MLVAMALNSSDNAMFPVIYKHVHEPGSHLLLQQKVPASYLKLQTRVREEAAAIQSSGDDPVVQDTLFRFYELQEY